MHARVSAQILPHTCYSASSTLHQPAAATWVQHAKPTTFTNATSPKQHMQQCPPHPPKHLHASSQPSPCAACWGQLVRHQPGTLLLTKHECASTPSCTSCSCTTAASEAATHAAVLPIISALASRSHTAAAAEPNSAAGQLCIWSCCPCASLLPAACFLRSLGCGGKGELVAVRVIP